MFNARIFFFLLMACPVMAFPPAECPKEGQCFCAPHPAYDTDCMRVDNLNTKTSRFFAAQNLAMYTAIHI